MSLPCDVARCPGREWPECQICRRRTDARRCEYGRQMEPPGERGLLVCEFWRGPVDE